METWQTPMVTLKANSFDVTSGTLDLACEEVTINPGHRSPPSASPVEPDRSEGRVLEVSGINPEALKEIDWTPRFISFSSVGALEPQQFEIRDVQLDRDGTKASFALA